MTPIYIVRLRGAVCLAMADGRRLVEVFAKERHKVAASLSSLQNPDKRGGREATVAISGFLEYRRIEIAARSLS